MEKFVKMLKENNVIITPQRLEVLKYLDGNRTHPNVDRIFTDLKRRNPSLSRTTVYNTLDTLAERGLVRVLTISASESRFDSVISPHHHFLCRTCGVIIDIDVKCPYIKNILKGGHRIDEVHGYFKGVCEGCLKTSRR
jgi:Fe2+ or Zn2+ uptake regulation protein